jgi:hypothetical protein
VERYGPFEKYTEVSASRGGFGVHPGEILEITADGILRYQAEDEGVADAQEAEDEIGDGADAQDVEDAEDAEDAEDGSEEE